MQYNTQQKKMALPEYGRSVQNMVDHAVTIADKEERSRCAHTIINIMGGMFPHLRDMPDFKHKLWDHLAIMSDFKLDIDYPYEITHAEDLHPTPHAVPYAGKKMRYRHYGKGLEQLIQTAADMEDGDKKDNLVALTCNHMKKSYIAWNKDSIDDKKIAADLYELSDGKLQMSEEVARLMAERMGNTTFARPNNGSNNTNGRQHNNQRNNQRRKRNNNS